MKKSNEAYGDTGELLISREEWVPPSELDGEENVLTSPHMKTAFEKIMDMHVKTSDICFLSLCTATRPYSKSFKYKTFIEAFGNKADIVINSNGGVIPLPFESEYPFMTYNAKRKNKQFDEVYYLTLCERLWAFLTKFEYSYVVANFNPDQRNYRYGTDVLNYALAQQAIKGFRFAPSAALRKHYKTLDKTFHQKLNPDTHPVILEDIIHAIENPVIGAVI